MADYLIRDFPQQVKDTISEMFPQQPQRGAASPRQRWSKTVLCIGSLGIERAGPVFDLWSCALQVAQWRRAQEELQPLESVRSKFMQEEWEFEEALGAYREKTLPFVGLLNRLANILYYAVQEYVQDYDILVFDRVVARYCELAQIPEKVALRCAAAKYLCRGEREEKQIQLEERAMLAVLEQFGFTLDENLTHEE